MIRNRILAVGISVFLVAGLFVGCGSNANNAAKNNKATTEAATEATTEEAKYKDGTYHAEEADFADNGWKETVDITVEDGKIVAANWNAVHKDGGDDKKAQSVSGAYGMVANGKAQAEWHEQAEKAEAYLIEKQDPTAIKYTDDEGHTDAITGVSIHVNSFFQLAEEALNGAK